MEIVSFCGLEIVEDIFSGRIKSGNAVQMHNAQLNALFRFNDWQLIMRSIIPAFLSSIRS
jgi:hypothetical protein